MAGLISTVQQTAIKKVFEEIHDTFARTVTVYSVQEAIFVASTNSLDWNDIYNNIGLGAVETPEEVVTASYKVRIHYVGRAMDSYMGDMRAAGVMVGLPDGVLRIKADKEANAAISSAKYIEIDGESYNVISGQTIVGPFGINFYTIYLQKGLETIAGGEDL